MLYAKCSLSYVEVISECECEGDEPVVLFIINSSIIRWCFSLVFRTNSKELNSQTFHKPIENMLKIPAQFLFLDLSFLIYHKLSDFFVFAQIIIWMLQRSIHLSCWFIRNIWMKATVDHTFNSNEEFNEWVKDVNDELFSELRQLRRMYVYLCLNLFVTHLKPVQCTHKLHSKHSKTCEEKNYSQKEIWFLWW